MRKYKEDSIIYSSDVIDASEEELDIISRYEFSSCKERAETSEKIFIDQFEYKYRKRQLKSSRR